MSLRNRAVPLDLSLGFEWHAVLKAHEQPIGHGRRVIYEMGLPTGGGPKLTVCLNRAAALIFVLTDLDGRELVTAPPVPHDEVHRFVEVGFVVYPPVQRRVRIGMFVNGAQRAEAEGEANLGGPVMVHMTFGSDVRGENPAAFMLGETLAYAKVLSAEEREQLYAYLRERHGLA